ncbi:uncharacterized protein MYCFIDRAFT_81955 [Pseudocercospora fijiensis CIRAD86]|uniref:Uncharacterized protein n=1 Tax=Pseudocercospora fijiensis (strain CIRAD86) TaxID=383855 RepID=M3B9R2_PSEFD|nr:uncharacterized protein MYCFIDRAFT_81955 [Pseudocercospora fijiensis CIRAD86]EME85998.1 hypothetical protein MYCFIDRAFT_81955 [Pseudocercospora fijiensis CIRAD86]
MPPEPVLDTNVLSAQFRRLPVPGANVHKRQSANEGAWRATTHSQEIIGNAITSRQLSRQVPRKQRIALSDAPLEGDVNPAGLNDTKQPLLEIKPKAKWPMNPAT